MNIKVYKYDPAVDAAARYITHEVPYKDKMTVLEALMYVHEKYEAVAFDYNCHGRMCGRCAIMADDVPTLACCTPITDEDHTFEPLKRQTVLRDLIVDKSDYGDRLSRQYLRVRTEPITEEEKNSFDAKAAETIWNIVNCTRCGMCDAACPVSQSRPDQFAGPSTMLAIVYRHLDSYDQADRILEAVSKGLYHCLMCGKCNEVCKRYKIDHVGLWTMLREEADKRGLKPSYA